MFAVSKPFTGDEMTIYMFFLRGGWSAIFQAWSDPFPPFLIDVANHPVNHILTYISINLFDNVTPWSLRLPSFLCGVATIPLAYGLAREATQSQRAGVFAAAALVLANGHVQWSGVSRGYASMILFAALLLWMMLRFQRTRSWWCGLLAVAAGVLMVYSQFVSLAVLAGLTLAVPLLAIWSGYKAEEGKRIRAGLASAGLNVLLLALIGLGAALAYLPQFSVFDVLAETLREGQLPADSFGQVPGVAGEETGSQRFPTWTHTADFIMGMGPVAGFIALALWLMGMGALARRNLTAVIVFGAVVITPVLAIWFSGASPHGRYLLFLLPVYAVGLGYFAHVLLNVLQPYFMRLFSQREASVRYVSALAGCLLIAALSLPATLRFIRDPHPPRSGPWHFDEAEAYIQREAGPADLVWLFPVGPDALAADTPGVIQPYGMFQELGGFGKFDYTLADRESCDVYYISPKAPDAEADYLPQGIEFESVAQFARSNVYRGHLDTPRNRPLPVPGGWTVYVLQGEHPMAIEYTGGNQFPITVRADYDGLLSVIRSAPFPVEARRLVQMLAVVEAQPRYLSLDQFALGLAYFNEQDRLVSESLVRGWPGADHPPDSGRFTLRLAEPVPPNAHTARFSLHTDPHIRAGDEIVIHSLEFMGDWE